MIRALLALVLLLPLAPHTSEAFVFRKIVYSSPVEGFVHWQGKPLANIKVTRLLQSGGFENGENRDHVQTDAQGRFNFDVVQERRFLRPDLLSANPSVLQMMWLSYEGIEYTFWSFDKLDFDLGTEAIGGVLRIECDLSKFETNSSGRIVRCKHNGVRHP